MDNEVYYYEVGEGRWEGKFDFQIKAWPKWRATKLGPRNTVLSLVLHLAGRLPGAGKMQAEILCDPNEGSGVARVEVSVRRFGQEIYRLRGHYALGADGQAVDIQIQHRYGPPGLPWFKKRASALITNGGFTGTYKMRLVGSEFEGVYQIEDSRTEMKGIYTADWATCVEHMRRTVPLKPRQGPARDRWQTLLDSARELEPLGRQYDNNNDPLGPFCHIYAYFMRELAYSLEARAFEDPDWIVRLGKTFVDIFVKAMAAHADPKQTGTSGWTIALELLSRRHLTVLDQLGLCMLVHISNDLPKALALVQLRNGSGHSRIADYHRVNDILIDSIDAMQDRLSARYNPIAGILDTVAGDMDERLTADIIRYARSVAWYDAERLSDPSAKRHATAEMLERIRTTCHRLQGKRPLSRLALGVSRRVFSMFRRTPRHPEAADIAFGAKSKGGPQWADTLMAAHTARGEAAGRVDLRGLHDYLHQHSAETLLSDRDAQRIAALLTVQGPSAPLDPIVANSPARWSLASALLDTHPDPTPKLKALGVTLQQAQKTQHTESALVGILKDGFDAGQGALQSAISGLDAVGIPADAIVTALDNVDGGYIAETDAFRASAAGLFPVPFDQVKDIVDQDHWDEVITHVEQAYWIDREAGVVYERINIFTPWITHHSLVLENELNAEIIDGKNERRVTYSLKKSSNGTFDIDEGFISVRRVDDQHTLVLVDKHIRVIGHPLLYALLRFNPDGLCALLTHWIHEAANRARTMRARKNEKAGVPTAINPHSHRQSARRPG